MSSSGGDDMPRRYDGESITWTPCGTQNGEELERSSIDVPMDQFCNKDNEGKVFSIPLLRLRGKEGSRNLLVNPGGPGSSGLSLIHRRGKMLREVVGDGFHILAFDPRGVGESRPAAIAFPNQELRERYASIPIYDLERDSSRISAWAKNFAKACADTMGEYGKFINTPQTAADLNSILDALGQRNLFYWGFSYGSAIGQTYATMFPDRCERVIIDGIVDIFEWYGGLLKPICFEDRQATLRGFLKECIRVGDRCALAQFGNNPPELENKITTLLEKLEKEPMDVYINETTYGILDGRIMHLAIFHNTFFQDKCPALAETLAQLLRGDGAGALLKHGLKSPTTPSLEHWKIISCNDGVAGRALWPQNLTELFVPYLRQYPRAIEQMEELYIKAHWTIEKTHNFVPQTHVQTLHPLLILSTTYDPATPLSSARRAREVFQDSRLIEIEGYGHTSVTGRSADVRRHVREYLNQGILPAEDTKCQLDSPYFP